MYQENKNDLASLFSGCGISTGLAVAAIFGFMADGAYFEWGGGPHEFVSKPEHIPASKVLIVSGCRAGIQGC